MSQADPAYTTNPSRRSILKGIPGGVLFGAAATITAAASVGFSIAYTEWKSLRDAHDAAMAALMGGWKRFKEPQKAPYRLAIDKGRHITVWQPDGRGFLYVDTSDENIAELRAVAERAPSGNPLMVAWEKAETPRFARTLEKALAYRKAREAALAEAGIPALRQASIAAGEALSDKSEEILAMKPNDIRELAMQARVAMQHGHDAEEWLDRMIEAAGVA
jgi:hypothetical protein